MAAHKGKRKPRTIRAEHYGKGSVYQDSQGRWWYQPPAQEGERQRRIRAEDEQGAILAQANHLKQRGHKRDAQSVETWFTFWFKEHVAPGLKPKTVEWYQFIIHNYILPAIGHMLLKDVGADHLIKLQNILRANLAPSVVRRVNRMLDRAFKKAIVSDKIDRNPMDAVEPPRVPRSKQEALSVDAVEKFRKATKGDRLELPFDLMLLQGFRRGEILGLLISEYDKKKGAIKVTGQIQTINGKTVRSGTPKSDNSVREIPLTPRQREMMDAHLDRIGEERRALGMRWKEHGLLFPSERGTPILPRNMNRYYYNLLIRAGIVASVAPPEKKKGTSGPQPTKRIATGAKIPLHRLRHTAATRLDGTGASPAVTSAILGHGPGSVTAAYIHPPMSALLEALLNSEREMLRRAA